MENDNVEEENQKILERQATKNADLARAYQKTFGTEDGQTVLADLMKAGYFLTPTYNPRLKTPQFVCDRNEGQRELVVYILEMIEKDPKQIMEVIRKSKTEEEDYLT